MPERVFVTGALGFIGRAISDRYRTAGAEVRGMDVRRNDGRSVVEGDVAEPGDWQRHAAGCDLVIHTAAYVSMRDDPDAAWRANTLGPRQALDAAIAGGAKRFVHLSSVVVFGFEHPDGVDERYPPRMNGVPYVDTKIAAEQVVLAAHAAGEIPVTVVRPGDVYGPRSRPWTITPVTELARGRLALPAMGRGVINPIFVENLVDGIVLASERDEAVGQIFTITDGSGITTREFFGHYGRMLGKRVTVVPTSVALAAAALAERATRGRTEINTSAVRYLTHTGTYSTAKAREVLGYSPEVSLVEAMEITERWLRSEGLA